MMVPPPRHPLDALTMATAPLSRSNAPQLAALSSSATKRWWLLPVMLDVMMKNPARFEGKPFYPVVD